MTSFIKWLQQIDVSCISSFFSIIDLELLNLISNAQFDHHPIKCWNVDKVNIKKKRLRINR